MKVKALLLIIGGVMIFPLSTRAAITGVGAGAITENAISKAMKQAEQCEYDVDLLANVVQAEAGSESDLCKVLVADVVINRMNDSDFPDSIYGVVSQKYQFSCFWDGGLSRHPATEHTKALVKAELESVQYPGVIYFRENYFEYGTPWKQVDSLYFSTK